MSRLALGLAVTLCASILCASMLCASMVLAADPPAPRVVLRGAYSELKKPLRKVVRSQGELEQLLAGTRSPMGRRNPQIKIDWKHEMALVVFLGTRPTAGYQVNVSRIKSEQGKLLATVTERKPSPDTITAQVLCTPYVVVAVRKSPLPVEFKDAELLH
jgi:hypothetical protein